MIRLLELILSVDLATDAGVIHPYVALPLFIFLSVVVLASAWIVVVYLKRRSN